MAYRIRRGRGGGVNLNRLKLGNSKLHKQLIFDLPAILTCPNCGDCAKRCYARPPERYFPGVLEWRMENFALAKDPAILLPLLRDQYDSMRNNYASRIHSSGDFFCPNYTKAWEKIAKSYPGRLFYAFTKAYRGFGELSAEIQRLNRLDNVNIINSLLGRSGRLNFGPSEYIARLVNGRGGGKYFVCPGSEQIRCGIECRYCLEGGQFPLFLEH